MKINDASKSLIGMARARPDKVKQVVETFHQLGPVATYQKVMSRLDSLTPIGYSLAGEVVEKLIHDDSQHQARRAILARLEGGEKLAELI